jgi:hypothetical protein
MSEYECMFVVDPLSDDLEEELASSLDAFVGGHGAVTLVTINIEGPDAVVAAQDAVGKMESLGVGVRRLYDDLVTRTQIATRAAVSTQGVGLWARGERQVDRPFPEPFVLAGGGLWRWGEVNEWLRQSGHKHDDVCHPSAVESAQLNSWLAGGRVRVDFYWEAKGIRRTSGPRVTIQSAGHAAAPISWVDADPTSFAMAS